MSIADLKCDEKGTILAASCDLCPYELLNDYYDEDEYDYMVNIYDYFYNDGFFCKGDCSWNSDVDECQVKGQVKGNL